MIKNFLRVAVLAVFAGSGFTVAGNARLKAKDLPATGVERVIDQQKGDLVGWSELKEMPKPERIAFLRKLDALLKLKWNQASLLSPLADTLESSSAVIGKRAVALSRQAKRTIGSAYTKRTWFGCTVVPSFETVAGAADFQTRIYEAQQQIAIVAIANAHIEARLAAEAGKDPVGVLQLIRTATTPAQAA
jgi:hypothetical protein